MATGKVGGVLDKLDIRDNQGYIDVKKHDLQPSPIMCHHPNVRNIKIYQL